MKTGEIIKGEDLKGKTLEVCEGGLLKVVEDKWPQYSDKVWHLDQYGRVDWTTWVRTEEDLFLARYNRIFPTRELAQEYADYLNKKAEISFDPDWIDESQFKYFFGYSQKYNKWDIGTAAIYQMGQQLYFPNHDCMNELVESIGVEKFLYFEFNIPLSGSEDM